MPKTKGSAIKEKPITDIGLAFRRFFTTLFGARCPNCGEGGIAKNFFNIKDKCPVCQANFDRGDDGNWLAYSTLNYLFTAVICVFVTLFLVRTYGFFSGLAFLVAGVALLCVVLLYRPSKLIGVWILWLFGFIYPN